MGVLDSNLVNTLSSLIQISVAPVFLLAGVAGLLNVFTGRLARIIDKVDKLDKLDKEKQKHPTHIRRRNFLIMRMENTNLAIFFSTTTGLLVALVIVTIFLSAILGFQSDTLISVLFILAMLCLILAFIVFLKEIYYTTSFIRSQKR